VSVCPPVAVLAYVGGASAREIAVMLIGAIGGALTGNLSAKIVRNLWGAP